MPRPLLLLFVFLSFCHAICVDVAYLVPTHSSTSYMCVDFSVHFFAWLAEADKKKIIEAPTIHSTEPEKMEQRKKARMKSLHVTLEFALFDWIFSFSFISIFDVLRVNTLAFSTFWYSMTCIRFFWYIFVALQCAPLELFAQAKANLKKKKKQIIVCNLFCLRWSKCRRSSQARENNNKNKIFSPSRRIWKIEEEKKMNQRTKAGKLYFIIDLACLLKRPLSPSVRSFTHSKSPSSPIAPFLLQPLFIHFSLCFACIHLYLRRSLRIEYRVKRKSWADTFFFCVKSFCRRRCCWCSHKWECCLPLKHKINIRRFMLLTVWRLTQDDKIEKLAFNWVKKRMWVVSSPTMKTTTNAQTAYPGPNTCGKIAQLNGLNPNTYFVYLC